MKILKKLKYKENGSITITVVAAMLFITMGVLLAYFSLSNQSNDQGRKIKKLENSYKVTNDELIQSYKNARNELNEITSMTYSQVRDLDNCMLAKQTNTTITDEDEESFVLPAGFKVTDDADRIENGMVIQDKDENEFVWVPVSSADLALMYAEDTTGWTMYGTNINTKYKTLGTTLDSRTINRTDPGVTTNNVYREPDTICGDGLEYDKLEENWTAAGFTSFENMAIGLKTDYKNMIDSIKTNGGFYIGRYELGINGSTHQVKKGTVKNETNWYDLYSSCKSFNTANVESRMMWDCQWDHICRFIKEHGDKVNLDNSKLYGNYTDSEGNAATNKGITNYNSTTGRNEAWKANNIYDLAGNCWEFTQGASFKARRSRRGRKLCLCW